MRPKTPRSARARSVRGPGDPQQPTFAEFLRELDLTIQAKTPVSSNLSLTSSEVPTRLSSGYSSALAVRRSVNRVDSITEEEAEEARSPPSNPSSNANRRDRSSG